MRLSFLPLAGQSAWATGLVLLVSSTLGGCDTGAVAVKECRDIEYARCEASAACGLIDDIDECKRFYRDHCLHGIAGPEVPSNTDHAICVEAINRSADCAATDREANALQCIVGDFIDESMGGMGGVPTNPDPDAPTVCDFVGEPWEFSVCYYLNEAVDDDDEGTGGSN